MMDAASLRVTIEPGWCIASGSCVAECPEVFAQDGDGMVVLLEPQPRAELNEKVRIAAQSCPAGVITVDES